MNTDIELTDTDSPVPGMKTQVWGSPLMDDAFRALNTSDDWLLDS